MKRLANVLEILLTIILLYGLAENQNLNLPVTEDMAGNETSLYQTASIIPAKKLDETLLLPEVPVKNFSQSARTDKTILPGRPFISPSIAPESTAIPEKPADIKPAITAEPITSNPEQIIITKEPNIRMPEQTTITEEPVINTPEQTIITEKPVINTPEQTIITEKPVIRMPEQITITEEPVIRMPEQITITEEPGIRMPEQTIITEEPGIRIPEQTIITEEPGIRKPEQTTTPEETKPDSDIDQNPSVEETNKQEFLCRGFICNLSGKIIGCQDVSVIDEVLCLPSDQVCTGIAADAFISLKIQVCEIYIPANIIAIEEGAFNGLTELWYIEVHPDNPVYTSREGCLYEK